MTALPAEMGSAAPVEDAPARVMLVDDHGLLAASLAVLLRGDGFDVAVEEPGPPEELLARARAHSPASCSWTSTSGATTAPRST